MSIKIMKYLLLLFPFFSLFSCEKNSESETLLTSACELRTINFDTSLQKFYNININGNHITQLTLATDTQTKQVYEFNNLNQFIKREDFNNEDNLGANLVRTRCEHFYDQTNNLIKIFQYNQNYSGGVALGLSLANIDSFFYSSNNTAEIRHYTPFNGTNIYQGVSKFSWVNDDLITLKQYRQNGQLYHSIDFTYDLTKENKFDSICKNFYIQELFEYGHQMEGIRRSKHILTSAKEEWVGNSPITRNYITTFNSNGFVESIQEKAYGLNYYIFRFGYLCG